MKRQFFQFVLVLLAAVSLLACDGQKCQEPKSHAEIEKDVAERVDGWMDEMDAYDLQREKVGEILDDLKTTRRPLTLKRRATRDAVIAELMKAEPDAALLAAEVKASRAYTMPHTWRMFDHVMATHSLFKTEQRVKLAEKLEEPPDEFSLGFIARRGIDLFLVSISASDAQKETFGKEVGAFERDTNALLRDQHAIRLELTREWRSKTPDVDAARASVVRGADSIEAFALAQIRRATTLAATFRDAKRDSVNSRLKSAMTCRDGQTP